MSDPANMHDAQPHNGSGQSDAPAAGEAHTFSAATNPSEARNARRAKSARRARRGAGKSRRVAPVDEGERERLRAQLMSAELDESEDNAEGGGEFAPGPNDTDSAPEGAGAPTMPPPGPPYTAQDCTRDVADVTRLALLGMAFVRAKRKRVPHDSRRIEGRVSRIAEAVAPRVLGRMDGALFWAGLAADVACGFVEDAINDALREPQSNAARAQTVDGAIVRGEARGA